MLNSLAAAEIEMIVVRHCEDRNALAAFLFPVCWNDLRRALPFRSPKPELLVAAIASWDIVEFFDTKKGAIAGAAAREPNRYVHIYVDSCRRASWAPHTSLQAALDIFLSDADSLYAAIPLANKATISIVRKLGFIQTSTENGVAFHVITPLTRKRFTERDRRRAIREGSNARSGKLSAIQKERD
jgi:hypothetical protein